jgi:hypothetical protein
MNSARRTKDGGYLEIKAPTIADLCALVANLMANKATLISNL